MKKHQEVIEMFREYRFSEYELEDLQKFLHAKEIYMGNKTVSNSADMKSAYSNIYMDIKHAWVRRKISKEIFDFLVDFIQEGLE